MLRRERVNKGTKIKNSLPLSTVVISYVTLQRKPLLTKLVSGPFRALQNIVELFFVKKVPLSRRVWYVTYPTHRLRGRVSEWISERRMYVTPIRLDLLLNTNQISCCEGKWYVRSLIPIKLRTAIFILL